MPLYIEEYANKICTDYEIRRTNASTVVTSHTHNLQ